MEYCLPAVGSNKLITENTKLICENNKLILSYYTLHTSPCSTTIYFYHDHVFIIN